MKKITLLLLVSGALALQGCSSKNSPITITGNEVGTGTTSSSSGDLKPDETSTSSSSSGDTSSSSSSSGDTSSSSSSSGDTSSSSSSSGNGTGSSSSSGDTSSTSSSSSGDTSTSSSSSGDTSTSSSSSGDTSTSSSSSGDTSTSSSSSGDTSTSSSSSGDTTSSSSTSSSSSSTSSSSSSGEPAGPTSVKESETLNGPKEVVGDDLDALLDDFMDKLVPMDKFTNVLDLAEDSGMDMDAVHAIQDSLTKAITAVGYTFGGDAAGGQIELVNDTGVTVTSVLEPAVRNKDAKYNYFVSQVVDGVAVDIEITFHFPGAKPSFSPSEGVMGATFEDMQITIAKMEATSGDVTLTTNPSGPQFIISVGAELYEAAPGDYARALIWAETFLEADFHASLYDSEADVTVNIDITGTLTDLDGDISFKDGSSFIKFNATDFTVSIEATGLSGGGTDSSSSSSSSSTSSSSTSSSSSSTSTSSSSSSTSSSSTSSSSSSSSSSGNTGPSVAEVILDGSIPAVDGATTGELLDNFIDALIPVDQFTVVLDDAEKGGMDMDAVTAIQDAVTKAITAVGYTFGGDAAGGQIELVNDTGVVVASTLEPAVRNKDARYTYVVDQLVDGVPVVLDITFHFPDAKPSFSPSAGMMGATFENMQITINAMTASSGTVSLVTETGSPQLIINLGAELYEAAPGDYERALIWSTDSFLEADLHASLYDSNADVTLKIDVTGSLLNLDGDIYLKDGAPASRIKFDAANFTVRMVASGDSVGGSGDSGGNGGQTPAPQGDASVGEGQFNSLCSGCHLDNGDGTFVLFSSVNPLVGNESGLLDYLLNNESTGIAANMPPGSPGACAEADNCAINTAAYILKKKADAAASNGGGGDNGGTGGTGGGVGTASTAVSGSTISSTLNGKFTIGSTTLAGLGADALTQVDTSEHADFFNLIIGGNNPANANGAGAEALRNVDAASMSKITAVMTQVGTALGVTFVNDLAGGQVSLDNTTGIAVASQIAPGAKNKDKSMNYVVKSTIDGVDVDIDITFDFPIANASFTPSPGSMGVSIEGMEVSINTLKVGTGPVWITAESTNPVAVLSVGAFLTESAPGAYESAEVWADELPLLVANMKGQLVDNDSGATIAVDVSGALSDLYGMVYLTDGTGTSSVDLDTNAFSVKVDASN